MNNEIVNTLENIIAKIENEKKSCKHDDHAMRAGLLKSEIIVRQELINYLNKPLFNRNKPC